MKTEAIKAVSNVMSRAISSSAKAETSAASHAVKGGEKLMAAGQDAAAIQGKVLVKKAYVKPEMTEVKMDKQNLKAASGGGYDGGGDWEPMPGGGRSEAKSNSFWDNDYSSSSIWE